MTEEKRFRHRKINASALSHGEFLFGALGIFCLLFILRNSEIAIEHMSQGLTLCAKTVVPSLFPFMVISELIVSGSLGSNLLRHLTRPFCKLFRLSSDACCAVLLGMLCGFPIGARCAVSAFQQGRISREEAERVLCFSNNPSSAFMISAVGGSLWGNPKFGVALYITVLSVSVFTGAVMARLSKQKEHTKRLEYAFSPSTPTPHGASLFCGAIRASVSSILLVCAYVVFFSALVGTFNYVPAIQKLPSALRALLFCFFELSGGVSQACALPSAFASAMLCAFAVGWSGISVHCQILSVCDGTQLSLRPYASAKIIQALLCPLLFAIVLMLFPSLLIPAVGI